MHIHVHVVSPIEFNEMVDSLFLFTPLQFFLIQDNIIGERERRVPKGHTEEGIGERESLLGDIIRKLVINIVTVQLD